jgi:hypothetical protein
MGRSKRRHTTIRTPVQPKVGSKPVSQEPILSDDKVRAMAQVLSDIFEGTKKLVIVSEATPDVVASFDSEGSVVSRELVHYRHTFKVEDVNDPE